MANKIRVAFGNPYNNFQVEEIITPLTNNVTLDVKSSFKSASSVLPSSDLLKKMFNLQNVLQGSVSRFQQYFDLMVWENTAPVRLNVELMLYTKTDPFADVYQKAMGLVSNTILIKDGDKFRLPGVSGANLYDFISSSGQNDTQTQASVRGLDNALATVNLSKTRVVSLEIPGIIYLDKCILESAKPTFSKEVTESGYPLWCKVQADFVSIFPANQDMFDPAIVNRRPHLKQGQDIIQNLFGV